MVYLIYRLLECEVLPEQTFQQIRKILMRSVQLSTVAHLERLVEYRVEFRCYRPLLTFARYQTNLTAVDVEDRLVLPTNDSGRKTTGMLNNSIQSGGSKDIPPLKQSFFLELYTVVSFLKKSRWRNFGFEFSIYIYRTLIRIQVKLNSFKMNGEFTDFGGGILKN